MTVKKENFGMVRKIGYGVNVQIKVIANLILVTRRRVLRNISFQVKNLS